MQRRIIWLYLRRILFLIVCSAAFAGSSRLPAQTVTAGVPAEVYEKVLNKLFPRPDKRDFTDGREFTLTLRFAPDEAQINVVKSNDGDFDVTAYRAASETGGVYAQIKRLLEKDQTLDADRLAAQIKITKQNVPPTAEVKRIINRFAALRLSPQLEAGIVLDAPQYDLEFETFSNRMRFQLQSKRRNSDRREYPLIKWMNELRAAVSKPRKSD